MNCRSILSILILRMWLIVRSIEINCSMLTNKQIDDTSNIDECIFCWEIFDDVNHKKKFYDCNCFIAICHMCKNWRKINVCSHCKINRRFVVSLFLIMKFDFSSQIDERYDIVTFMIERVSSASLLSNAIFLHELWIRSFDVIEIKFRIPDYFRYID